MGYYDSFQERWKLCWDARRDTGERVTMYAYSDNSDPQVPGSWTIHGEITVPQRITTTICYFTPFRIGNLRVAYYIHTTKALCAAYSGDDINWTYIGIVIPLGGAGEWDDRLIHSFGITYIFGTYYIIYAALDNANFDYKIGVAYNSSPFSSFTKLLTNPIIDYGNSNCFSPRMTQDNQKFLIYYFTGLGPGYIGTIP